MKTIGKLKLAQLSKAELSKREQNRLLGGENCCICSCSYPIAMTSDSAGGMKSNGLYSPGGGYGTGSSA